MANFVKITQKHEDNNNNNNNNNRLPTNQRTRKQSFPQVIMQLVSNSLLVIAIEWDHITRNLS